MRAHLWPGGTRGKKWAASKRYSFRSSTFIGGFVRAPGWSLKHGRSGRARNGAPAYHGEPQNPGEAWEHSIVHESLAKPVHERSSSPAAEIDSARRRGIT